MQGIAKFKRFLGPFLAVIVILVVVGLGFYLGKNISYAYVQKNHNEVINEIFVIEQTVVPLKYVLQKGSQKVTDLCEKETGLCDAEVGIIVLDRLEVLLYIYYSFDNPDDQAVNYFKIGDRKISGFVYLDRFEIFDSKYLVVTEPNNANDNYIIHIYNYKGNELISYDATDNDSPYQIKNQNLYFSYCNVNDSMTDENNEILYNYTKFRVNGGNILKKIVETSEYQKCA